MDSNAGIVASGAITSASFAANAIDSGALATTAVTEITDGMKAKILETQGSYTHGQMMSLMFAALCGQTASGGTTLKTPDGVSTRIAATTDGSNNRTAMILTPST
jgi:VCBS repeat-containing protein